MKKIYQLLTALAIMLLSHVSTAFAASITYSLTTHIDGRTIEQTVSLNSGLNLGTNMPQKFWRAYTTYKYYSDEEMTNEITVVPDQDATVYVDYVFDSPFINSTDGAEYYYYFNAFISSTKYFLCDDLGSVKSNAATQYRNHALWALFGDGYCLNLKAKQTSQWLTYSSSAPVMADAPMATGWQLYESDYTNNGKVYSTCVLGTTNNDNQVLHFDNNATAPNSAGIPQGKHAMGRFVLTSITSSGWNGISWNSKHKLIHASNSSTNTMSNSCFFFTLGTNQNIYSTIWHILQADGTWYRDIVVQKGSSATTIGMPTGQNKYTEKSYCNYDRYYMDATFTEKYADDYSIPVTGNTIIYVKETYKNGEPFVTDHWVTMALSYDVNDLGAEFGYASDGVTPAVRVLEYYDVSSNETGTQYNLKFREVNSMEAHKPYLFKADVVLDGKNLNLQKSDADTYPLQESYVEDKAIHLSSVEYPSSVVSMTGTYEGKQLTVQSEHPELLYFYFGWVSSTDKYNFYRVTKKNVTISPHRCYFQIDTPSEAVKFTLMDSFDQVITTIEDIEGVEQIPTGRIYNLNGQMVGTNWESLPNGVYIVNGKKIVK